MTSTYEDDDNENRSNNDNCNDNCNYDRNYQSRLTLLHVTYRQHLLSQTEEPVS